MDHRVKPGGDDDRSEPRLFGSLSKGEFACH
jgi:hypothetical protein